MSCGAVMCLSSYSVLVTIVLVIISCLYHNSNNYQRTTCTTGTDCKQAIQNHLDILNVDLSENEITTKGDNRKCTTLTYLGFEIFEMIILTLILIGIAYLGVLLMKKGKQWYKKWILARKTAKENKFEQMRARYEASTSKRGKVKVKPEPKQEPKREPKREPKKEEPVSYEKGGEYVEPEMEYESDFEESC